MGLGNWLRCLVGWSDCQQRMSSQFLVLSRIRKNKFWWTQWWWTAISNFHGYISNNFVIRERPWKRIRTICHHDVTMIANRWHRENKTVYILKSYPEFGRKREEFTLPISSAIFYGEYHYRLWNHVHSARFFVCHHTKFYRTRTCAQFIVVSRQTVYARKPDLMRQYYWTIRITRASNLRIVVEYSALQKLSRIVL